MVQCSQPRACYGLRKALWVFAPPPRHCMPHWGISVSGSDPDEDSGITPCAGATQQLNGAKEQTHLSFSSFIHVGLLILHEKEHYVINLNDIYNNFYRNCHLICGILSNTRKLPYNLNWKDILNSIRNEGYKMTYNRLITANLYMYRLISVSPKTNQKYNIHLCVIMLRHWT